MMEKKELIDTINLAINFALSNLHTSLIAKVVAVNDKTIDVLPVINRVVDGVSKQLSVFTKVPPIFLQGGSSYEAWPIAVGDYCLLVLNERCYDRWYDGADFQDPADFRMHDYSDAFAICGIKNKVSAITIPALITRVGDSIHTGDHEQTGDTTRTGDLIQTGDIDLTGSLDASGSINGASFSVGGVAGMSGTVTAGGFIMTFTNGLITGLVPVP